MSEMGFAVLDFETTGLWPEGTDRVAEVAIIHMDESGREAGRWETLINPGRDLGPQRIHGIRADEILDAPRFEDVAEELISLLEGRAIVAHNAHFDLRFLRAELMRIGAEVEERIPHLCTMQLGRMFLPGSRRALVDCCRAFDIEYTNHHRAMADAEATSKLLLAFIESESEWGGWGDVLVEASEVRWVRPPASWMTRPSNSPGMRARWKRRQETTPRERTAADFLGRLVEKVPPPQVANAFEEQYLALVDRALLDRVLSAHEVEELFSYAASCGIVRGRCEELHLEYFAELVRLAWEDHVLTEDEREDLERVASLLCIPPEVLEAAMVPPPEVQREETHARNVVRGIELVEGDVIVLTGEMKRQRSEWKEILEARGLIVKGGVSKKVKLLIAADPDSLSGKAKKAREYGIPIVSEGWLEDFIQRRAVG